MKLNNKILLGNLILSVVIFLLTAIGMYFLVIDTVYDELDNHLLQHKMDIIEQVQGEPESLKEIQKLGGLGSYEWVDISIYEGRAKESTNYYSTLDTTRSADDETLETYRRLASVITVDGNEYSIEIYEEVAAWQNISRTILLSVLAGLLIWILMLYMVNQIVFEKILTPFYKTVDTLESILNPTDFNEQFPESTTFEINVLNEALNTMMGQIRTSFEDQKKFIQNASHELLTPLSIIRQKAEKILSNSDQLDRQTVETANEIQQTAVRLSRLSNALLNISRVENKQFVLNEQVDIRAVTTEALDELQDFFSLKNISLEKEFCAELLVLGNKELIHSAIYNILQNAVKFSPEKSKITITITTGAGQNKIVVADEGPGIPEELKKSLFDRFKKGNRHINELGQDNGNGLGLSLVKSICKLHGFSYKAENKNGAGAEVTLIF